MKPAITHHTFWLTILAVQLKDLFSQEINKCIEWTFSSSNAQRCHKAVQLAQTHPNIVVVEADSDFVALLIHHCK